MARRARIGWTAVLLGTGLLVGGWLVVSSPAATHSPCSQRPHLGKRRILRIAERSAASAGDRRPTLIQHSEGTGHTANRVDSGEGVPGCRWSYLIAERGHFVFRDVGLAGTPAPRGTVLTLVVDAATAHVTDVGLGNRYPNLARLGPVTTDLIAP